MILSGSAASAELRILQTYRPATPSAGWPIEASSNSDTVAIPGNVPDAKVPVPAYVNAMVPMNIWSSTTYYPGTPLMGPVTPFDQFPTGFNKTGFYVGGTLPLDTGSRTAQGGMFMLPTVASQTPTAPGGTWYVCLFGSCPPWAAYDLSHSGPQCILAGQYWRSTVAIPASSALNTGTWNILVPSIPDRDKWDYFVTGGVLSRISNGSPWWPPTVSFIDPRRYNTSVTFTADNLVFNPIHSTVSLYLDVTNCNTNGTGWVADTYTYTVCGWRFPIVSNKQQFIKYAAVQDHAVSTTTVANIQTLVSSGNLSNVLGFFLVASPTSQTTTGISWGVRCLSLGSGGNSPILLESQVNKYAHYGVVRTTQASSVMKYWAT